MTFLFTVLACSETDPESGTDPSPVEETPTPVVPPRPVEEPSGACPTWAASGTQDLVSNGADRQIEAYWPQNHEGPIGLLYAWHGLGDRANSFGQVLDLDDFANENDILVVVPWSQAPDLVTWNFLSGGGDDLALFEDVRNCAAQHFELDTSRVWSMGFSFGAIWTTFLTMQSSDILAGSVVFSGGTGDSIQLQYFTPVRQIPVLAAWGGAADQYNGLVQADFSETTADFTDHLEADGHTVVRCDHGLGHTVPYEYDDILKKFLLKEVFGVPSPHADGDVSDLPSYCFGAE